MFLKQEEVADLLTLVAYYLVQMFFASSSFVWELGSSFVPFALASFVLVLKPSPSLHLHNLASRYVGGLMPAMLG